VMILSWCLLAVSEPYIFLGGPVAHLPAFSSPSSA
jgi:hypothetical protein